MIILFHHGHLITEEARLSEAVAGNSELHNAIFEGGKRELERKRQVPQYCGITWLLFSSKTK